MPPKAKKTAPRITIVDVATRAAVSLGTVSRVINLKESVGTELRERVLEAARALGYAPDFAAQSMRSRTTRVVGGIMVPDVSNPLFSRSVSAIEEVLYRSVYTMMLANGRARAETENEIITLFQRRRFDGMPGRARSLAYLAAHRAAAVPIDPALMFFGRQLAAGRQL